MIQPGTCLEGSRTWAWTERFLYRNAAEAFGVELA
jgi:hypothetical protein